MKAKRSLDTIIFAFSVFASCIAISAASAPVASAACRVVFQGIRSRLQCDIPTINDISREIQNCFSGGCDPGTLINKGIGAEEIWGEAGRYGYPAAAEWMDVNNRDGRPLTDYQKGYLRRFFGDLVDRVRVTYNANMMDEWSAYGFSITPGSDGQTFCNDIYINRAFQEDSQSQLVLLSHELVHVEQCDRFGGKSDFGYHYFKEYKKANQVYENNRLEREAETLEVRFERALIRKEPGFYSRIGMDPPGILYLWPSPWNGGVTDVYCDVPNHDMFSRWYGEIPLYEVASLESVTDSADYWSEACSDGVFTHSRTQNSSQRFEVGFYSRIGMDPPGILYLWPSPWDGGVTDVYCNVPNHDMFSRWYGEIPLYEIANLESVSNNVACNCSTRMKQRKARG